MNQDVVMTDSHERIERAQALYRRGDQDAARAALATLLKDEPNNADAWYNAAQMATSAAQSIKLLQRALDIDPFHEEADVMLARLQTGAIVDEPAPMPVTSDTPAPQPQKESQAGRLGMVVAIIIAGLILAGLLILLADNLGVIGGSNNAAVPTLAALPTATSVPVVLPTEPPPQPTATPAPTLTPTLAVYDITATAYRDIERTQVSGLALTGTAAAEAFSPPG